MKIITRRSWLDKEFNKIRRPGDIQEVTEARYREIVRTLKEHKDDIWVEPEEEKEAAEEETEDLADYDDITTKQIKELLDEKGIEYKANDSKKALYKLLAENL